MSTDIVFILTGFVKGKLKMTVSHSHEQRFRSSGSWVPLIIKLIPCYYLNDLKINISDIALFEPLRDVKEHERKRRKMKKAGLRSGRNQMMFRGKLKLPLRRFTLVHLLVDWPIKLSLLDRKLCKANFKSTITLEVPG